MFRCCFKKTDNVVHPNLKNINNDLNQTKYGIQSEFVNLNAVEIDKECWICFCDGDIESQCECKNLKVHKKCLAKWQLTNLGKPEEINCRFCNKKYNCSWRDVFYKIEIMNKVKCIIPEVTINYNGETKDIKLYSNGFNAFLEIMSHFVLNEDRASNFECLLTISKTEKTMLLKIGRVNAELMNNIILCAQLTLYKNSIRIRNR